MIVAERGAGRPAVWVRPAEWAALQAQAGSFITLSVVNNAGKEPLALPRVAATEVAAMLLCCPDQGMAHQHVQVVGQCHVELALAAAGEDLSPIHVSAVSLVLLAGLGVSSRPTSHCLRLQQVGATVPRLGLPRCTRCVGTRHSPSCLRSPACTVVAMLANCAPPLSCGFPPTVVRPPCLPIIPT